MSGGWSGFNAAMHASLSRHFALKYVGPIAPPPDLAAKVRSKLWRVLGCPGSFQIFSGRRLKRVANEVQRLADREVELCFFHGSTPWVSFAPLVPYACYVDACFATYVAVYHAQTRFDGTDLRRIEALEASWLRGATRVFFSSTWALEEAARAYDLDRSTLRVAGLGGHVPIPVADDYAGGHEFLFVALDFAGKGGHVCVDAFERVQREIPDARLRIVGERPPEPVLVLPGVVYEGRLDKSNPVELRRLRTVLASAFALVHPTVKDATPQVIVEAQYHGCPVIAPASFGIPEMVVDGVTGCLTAAPPTAAHVAERMLWLCRNPESYRQLRISSRTISLSHFTWDRVGDRIATELGPLVA
jgi:glycosyltransferase involved in cell wall biosynthesis